ncbi:MAG: oxidoreductase [Candidatus Omnitrophica bacterium CG11_big_fil_rev_8_21_14_0_20_64_10]|nr:MAG: oxidoreductase [Candidatus Omnitrophica bacterium CG11_big_fil_rev_8_21_14_0_20_64_10]
MTTPPIRKLLLVGLGAAGQRHLRNFRTLLPAGTQFLAYRSGQGRTPVLDDRMQPVPGGRLEGVRSFDSLEAALREKPEAAVIANPTRFHLPAALACARAGCHLLIEKPLSDSLEGLPELAEVVARQGRVATVGYPFRFHPGIRRVRDWLKAGRIGRLLEARLENGEYLPAWHAYEDYRTGYAARRDLGGGALLTQIHELDLALWLFGMPSRLFAVGGRSGELELDVEDTVSALMEIPQGGRPLPVQMHLDYLQKRPVRRLEILGSGGRIRWDYPANETVLLPDTGGPERIRHDGFERNQMFLAEARDFLEAIGGGAPAVSLEEGIRGVAVALQLRKSMQTGKEAAWASVVGTPTI